ncbi:Arginyl-tRNA--protein transferase 1 [Borealophlyctis nickersoniae]|nr:Arginyl-tRNA--protein transferase 1 [Borealophlyctis nickersoniae]
MPPHRPSFVAVTGQNASSCGYCHSGVDTSISFGAWAYSLSCADYQQLLDKGWRRSGKYLYKPDLSTTCCPPYTIRLDVGKFSPSKGHKKVVKKVRKWIADGAGEKRRPGPSTTSTVEGALEELAERDEDWEDEDEELVDITEEEAGSTGVDLVPRSESDAPIPTEQVEEPARPPPPAPQVLPAGQSGSHVIANEPNVDVTSLDSSKRPHTAPFGKNHDLPAGKRQKGAKPPKQGLQGGQASAPQDFIAVIQDAEKYSGNPKGHKLKVVLERASYQEETYQLFRKYQIAVHKDPPGKLSPQKYKQFLVDTPLVFEPPQIPNTPGYGSFHQKYYADGKLIAVGVIDILPLCVSSVYFMYDPDYGFLSLGVYSALREIAFTKLLHNGLPELKYYYMGFYIHSCAKMRYKAHYKPSDLACPQTFVWVPAEKAQLVLDQHKRATLVHLADGNSETATSTPPSSYVLPSADGVSDAEVGSLMSYNDGNILHFRLSEAFRESKTEVKQLYALVGPDLARRMVIVA